VNEIILKDVNNENMIYEINEVEVMLDSDLANLYHVVLLLKTWVRCVLRLMNLVIMSI